MSARILLVEDEPGLSLTLSDLLANEGYEVETAMDGVTGLDHAASGRFDLVVLDLMLPRINGLEVCRELRRRGKDVAILMLTAKSQLTDRVAGLKLGADDYLTKPFEPPELLARIEALLRRTKKETVPPLASFQFDDIDIDFERNHVTRAGAPVSMASKELELLRYLITPRQRGVVGGIVRGGLGIPAGRIVADDRRARGLAAAEAGSQSAKPAAYSYGAWRRISVRGIGWARNRYHESVPG
jgi:DNA-binding response OmpR family regulator